MSGCLPAPILSHSFKAPQGTVSCGMDMNLEESTVLQPNISPKGSEPRKCVYVCVCVFAIHTSQRILAA